MLTAEQIQQNWKNHGKILKNSLSEDRVRKVFKMYYEFGDEIILAPASGKTTYHNAFPGGYIDHINRVVEFSISTCKLWKDSGILTGEFTEEELVFSALFHDLGKIGLPGKPNYLTQTNDWRKNNLGELYTPNPDLDFMLIQDRSLFTLQFFEIKMTQVEYLTIKTHDGLYDDTNKPYYISYNPSSRFKSSLPYIIHHADLLATNLERQIVENK